MCYTIILIDKYGGQKLPSIYISKWVEAARCWKTKKEVLIAVGNFQNNKENQPLLTKYIISVEKSDSSDIKRIINSNSYRYFNFFVRPAYTYFIKVQIRTQYMYTDYYLKVNCTREKLQLYNFLQIKLLSMDYFCNNSPKLFEDTQNLRTNFYKYVSKYIVISNKFFIMHEFKLEQSSGESYWLESLKQQLLTLTNSVTNSNKLIPQPSLWGTNFNIL